MGQDNSSPVLVEKRIKRIQVRVNDRFIYLNNVPRDLTMSALISQINHKLNDLCRVVVSVVTLDINASVNYWLSMPERSLHPINNDEILTPVFYQKVPLKISMACFELIQVIGRGAYSVVSKVRKKDTGMIYAMKSIEKRKILREKLQQHIKAEKQILSTVKSPFVAQLHWAFQTKNKLHFVMDFYPGGELYFHLRNIRFFTEEQSRFYFAEILVGLHSLHMNEIAYRDLKPENIVLDIDGHVKLTDFGLSRLDMYETSMSFCGSPEYMSPEVILGEGHNKTVDFYCLGALLYEMLTGFPPYYDRDTNKMHQNVLNAELDFPETMSADCKNLLSGLLAKDPHNRLGNRGAEEIMTQDWCKKINWEAVKNKELKPPFPLDLRKCYFEARVMRSPLGFLSDSESADSEFADFDYKVEVKNDDISRQYFEAGKARSSSQRNGRLSICKKGNGSTISGFVSPYLSPVHSLNASCLNPEFVRGERTGRKGNPTRESGILSLSGGFGKMAISGMNSPGGQFREFVKSSVYNIFSKFK